MNPKKAIIIGAGPAGLTAAYELLDKTDILPVIYEMTGDIGGISKTVNYKGNRIDIGGHRFYSKSKRVMDWWQNILPLQGAPAEDDIILDRKIPLSEKSLHKNLKSIEFCEIPAPDPQKNDQVMLNRSRLSRIFFLRKFFDYPVSLNLNTFMNLGVIRILKIGLSYIKITLFPIKSEKSLEDFFINKFGKELYLIFFKDYTEKVWGISCNAIKPDWGSQRIKGLSITKAVIHALKKFLPKGSQNKENVETSLIGQFMYPKFGPGHMWEEVAKIIQDNGGQINLKHKIIGIKHQDNKITGIVVKDENTGNTFLQEGAYYFSSMPIKDLIQCFEHNIPENVSKISDGLIYRDFITVGLLLNKLKIKNETNIKTVNNIIPDNWIYIQERDVKVGRIQIFNNWSPYMVHDKNNIWIGLEYFCNEGDQFWMKPHKEMIDFAVDEMAKIGFLDKQDVIDSVVIHMPKAYPAYFGTYDHFNEIRKFTDIFENLFLVGRNGMHRYNNMDHSVMTSMISVENIINDIKSKNNIWLINTEEDYHEEK